MLSYWFIIYDKNLLFDMLLKWIPFIKSICFINDYVNEELFSMQYESSKISDDFYASNSFK